MFSTFLTVALFVAPVIRGVMGDFTVDTVPLTQCQDATVTWGEGAGPYNLYVVDVNNPCGDELLHVGQFDTTSATFKVPLPEDTRVQLYVESADDEGWSGAITVARSGDTSCILPNLVPTPDNLVDPAPTGSTGDDNTGAADDAPSPPSNNPPSGPQQPPSGDGGIAPVGAANSGLLDGSAALSTHPLSVSAVALGALTALVAFTL